MLDSVHIYSKEYIQNAKRTKKIGKAQISQVTIHETKLSLNKPKIKTQPKTKQNKKKKQKNDICGFSKEYRIKYTWK